MKRIHLFTLVLLVSAMILSGCQNGVVGDNTLSRDDASANKELITMETAMYVSASSQQISSENVTFTSVELNEGNESTYEVKFIYDGHIYNVDVDAKTGEVNGEQIEEIKPDDTENVIDHIGRDAAIKAAFEKAGFPELTVDEVERLLVKLDRDDGKDEYEIEFIYNGIEYEIELLAEDGAILDFDKEPVDDDYDDYKDGDYDDDDNDVKVEATVTKDEALAIALEHAQLTKDDIKGLRIKLERDDGKVQYEIEFYSDSLEFDYDVDAISGEIISFDRDAEHVSLPDHSYPDSSELISEEAAKLAAFEHAGVNEADVYGFEIELENERGVSKYEIEFSCGEYEYEYDINALDGSVLNYSKEIDD